MGGNNDEQLNAAEVGKLWTTYVGNSLFSQVLKFIYARCDDREIKQLIGFADKMSNRYLKTAETYFKEHGHPVPLGLTITMST